MVPSSSALLLALSLLRGTLAIAGEASSYSGPRAAFGLLDPSSTGIGLNARLGRAVKHLANPLWGQDRDWETRIDNGYAEVFHDPKDPDGAWRVWYTTFTECASDKRDDQGRWVDCGSGKRWYGMLYANSSDGIRWSKPDLENGICYVPGQHTSGEAEHFACNRTGALKTNIVIPGVIGTGIYKDTMDSSHQRQPPLQGPGRRAWPRWGGG